MTYQDHSHEILHAVRAELTWTHYRLLMKVENIQARSFYEIECIKNHWATRELERQINSLLFERLSLSRDKKGIIRLAKRGQEIQKTEDLVKNPYILEFVGLKESFRIRETTLENTLIEHLREFILELGRGFSFVARQTDSKNSVSERLFDKTSLDCNFCSLNKINIMQLFLYNYRSYLQLQK